jgi:O-antigen ligase
VAQLIATTRRPGSPWSGGQSGFVVLAILVPLFCGALIARNPVYGIALLVVIGAVWLAVKSIVYPLALGGVPSLLIGLYGTNPLPSKGVFVLIALWLFLGLGVALLSGAWPSSPAVRRILSPPVFLIGALSILLIARIDPGAYPKVKLELFFAQCVPVLFAGILVGLRARTLRLYIYLEFAVAVANAVVLTYRLNGNSATQTATARFSIGTAYNPIWAGRSAATGVLIAMALVLASRSRRSSIVGYVALPFLAAALLASGSRGPLVGLILALCVLVGLTVRQRKLRSRLVGIGIAVLSAVAIAAAVVPSDALNRSASFLFGNSSDLASNGRSGLWSKAISLFFTHPWTGVGTGGFAHYEPDALRYPHDIVLEAGAELGVLGMTIVVAFLYLALRTAFTGWALAREREDKIMAALIASMLVAAVANALLSDALETTDTLLLVAGLAYGIRARLAAAPVPATAPAFVRRPVLPARG